MNAPPVEPPATPWQLPSPADADEKGLAGVGADFEPGTLLAAYRRGLFPMPLRSQELGWWSPDPRGILPVDGLKVTKSMRTSQRRFETRMNTSFEEVMRRCADPSRPNAWINDDVISAYTKLHDLGWAHSVETWLDDELVGGLYGLRIAGLFAGESMFHTVTDASKVALMALVEWLRSTGGKLIDVQWLTPHLASLGAVEISRDEYLARLREATT